MDSVLYTFVIGYLTIAAFLIVAPYPLLRCAGLPPLPSLAIGPLLVVGFCELLAIVCSLLNMSMNWLIFAIAVALLFIVSTYCFLRRGNEAWKLDIEFVRNDFLACVVLVTASVVAYSYVYLSEAGSFSFLVQGFDTVFHVNLVRRFLDTGFFSPLNAGVYSQVDSSPLISSIGGFYPAAWHLLAAFVCEAVGASVALGSNIVNAVAVTIMFPVGVWSLLRCFVRLDVKNITSCCLTLSAFAAFPWAMLIRGEQYPQMLAFCFVPAMASILYLLVDVLLDFESSATSVWQIVFQVFLVFVSLIGLALCQPNACFAVGLFAVPYLLFALIERQERDCCRFGAQCLSVRRWAAPLALVVAACALWSALFFSPFMEGVVSFSVWRPFTTMQDAVRRLFELSLSQNGDRQIVLSVLVFVGCFCCLVNKQSRCLLMTLSLYGVIYIANVSAPVTVQHFLSGFWYSDPDRIAAILSIAAAPVSCIGLSFILDAGYRFARKVGRFFFPSERRCPTLLQRIVPICMALTMAVAVYSPGDYSSGDVDHPFGDLRQSMHSISDPGFISIYDLSEQQFVSAAMQYIEPGAVIANVPDDGSSFLYGLDGLDILYRRNYVNMSEPFDPSKTSESSDGILVRTDLVEMDSNPVVAASVSRLKIKYVLVLDSEGRTPQSALFHTYRDQDWRGITSITEDTPGFSLLLASGDMKLFKVDNVA